VSQALALAATHTLAVSQALAATHALAFAVSHAVHAAFAVAVYSVAPAHAELASGAHAKSSSASHAGTHSAAMPAADALVLALSVSPGQPMTGLLKTVLQRRGGRHHRVHPTLEPIHVLRLGGDGVFGRLPRHQQLQLQLVDVDLPTEIPHLFQRRRLLGCQLRGSVGLLGVLTGVRRGEAGRQGYQQGRRN